MPDAFDISQQPAPDPGSSNEPSSGPYGEKAALTRLQQSLPQAGPGGPGGPPGPGGPGAGPGPLPPGPTSASPQPPGAPMGRPTGGQPPPGLPPVVLQSGPTGTAPPSGPPQDPLSGVSTPQQGRLLVLHQLVMNPDVSSTTRQWAQMLIKTLVG